MTCDYSSPNTYTYSILRVGALGVNFSGVDVGLFRQCWEESTRANGIPRA